jgi:hypothetical protein
MTLLSPRTPAVGHFWGLYLSAEADLGLILGVSFAASATVVAGPPSALAGPSWVFHIAGGELAVVGVTVLYKHDPPFKAYGAAAEQGVGFGVPVNVYAGLSATTLAQY